MRNRVLLNSRLNELSLTRAERRVALCLIAGMRWRETAAYTGLSPHEVRIRAICIERKLGRLPPSDPDPMCVANGPPPTPLAPGSELGGGV